MKVIYNDFVIRFANVNGSGSASANGMFTKALIEWEFPFQVVIFSLPIYKVCPLGMKSGLAKKAI